MIWRQKDSDIARYETPVSRDVYNVQFTRLYATPNPFKLDVGIFH